MKAVSGSVGTRTVLIVGWLDVGGSDRVLPILRYFFFNKLFIFRGL